MKIVFLLTLSGSLKKIFWDVFFVSKNRGISLAHHFPWLEDSTSNIIFCEALVDSVVVGGLVIRNNTYLSGNRTIKIASIGLVCVRPEYRGKGVAKALLNAAIEYSKEKQLDYLTLWTSQHAVYSKHGFQLKDPWLFGWVEKSDTTPQIEVSEHWVANQNLPLPPYALRIFEQITDQFHIVLVEDKLGFIVVNYEGNANAAATAMLATLPNRWRLNATQGDLIIDYLKKSACCDLLAVNLQMWFDLQGVDSQCNIANEITIPVLDRI